MKTIVINEPNIDTRLDKYLPEITGLSRGIIQEMIKDGDILVNGKCEKNKYIPKLNDVITIKEREAKSLDLVSEDLQIEVLYEDSDVAVVYKPEGMVVHPANGNASGTLVNGLLHEMELSDTINDVVRPGIVHRIDKDTSGVLMIAKNDIACKSLQEQLKNHSCNRTYIALVYGIISEDKGRIEAPIGRDPVDRKKMAVVKDGKPSITNFKVLERFKEYTLIECKLETGRTHQIRVHMKYIGHPLVGDKVYGPRKVVGEYGQYLHAKTIGFIHPTKNEYMEFSHELPLYFTNLLEELREKKLSTTKKND